MPIPSRLKQYFIRLAIDLAIVLLLYVLSIGPMFWYWFEAKHLNGSRWILTFYEPLRYACKIDIICEIINWYIRLWIL